MAQDRYEKRNFTVVGVFGLVLCLFFVSGAWADSCVHSDYGYTVRSQSCYPYTSQGWRDAMDDCANVPAECPDILPIGNGSYRVFSGRHSCFVNQTNGCSYPVGNCLYDLNCGSCAADSVSCIRNGGQWKDDLSNEECGKSCQPPCDDKCQCEEEGGTWMPQGYCLPNCQTRGCCDSLNWRLPTTYDTTWNGCVSADGTNSCAEKHSYTLDGQVARTWYVCDGLASFRICATRYVFDREGCKTTQLGDACVDVTRSDERCENVNCYENWDKQIRDLVYSKETECWNGSYRLVLNMECDNGVATMPTYGEWHDYTVCDSYLDSTGQNLGEFLSGDTPGGESTNALGELVQNSAGGGQGGSYNETTHPLTKVDSSTGETVIVKNSQGGDSMVTTTKFTQLTCLGVVNGVATLKNGTSTWTCSGVMSCSQAELKYRLGSGCEGGESGSTSPRSSSSLNIGWGDSVFTVVDSSGVHYDYSDAINNLSKTATWFYNFFAFPAEFANFASAVNAVVSSINSGTERSISQRDSIYDATKEQLWKAVFGDDLNNITTINESILSASSAASQGNSAVVQAVNSASSANSNAISNAVLSLNEHSTIVSNGIKSAISSASGAITLSIGDARTDIVSIVSSASAVIVDTAHRSNMLLERVADRLDTGSYIDHHITQVRDSVASLNSAFAQYQRMVSENWLNMETVTLTLDTTMRAVRDTGHTTNVILSEIKDKLDGLGSSASEQVAEVDTTVRDTGDYALDAEWEAQDSAVTAGIQVITDSMSGLVASLKRGMDSTIAHVDSVRADTNNNMLAMDSIYKWHNDTTKIKQKLSNYFLPSQISNNCFICTYNEPFGPYNIDLRFDFGNFHGMDFCHLIRLVIRVMVTITIIFSTVAAFIRAFGGGGGGSP